MSLLKSLILGIVQGLTEFLPVSSSGHLVIFQELLGVNEPGVLLEIVVHLGTLVAVVFYFWTDIKKIIKSLFHWGHKTNAHDNYYHNLLLYLLIATAITGFFGIIFKDFLEPIFENLLLVGFMLLITGVILYLSDRIKEPKKEKVGPLNSIIVGIAQSFAIIPGISRSGTTITSGLFTGLNRDLATKFSFLLSIPAILGAAIFKYKDLNCLTKSINDLLPYLLSGLAAAIVGYLSIALLVKMIKRAKLVYFSVYCWLLGIFIIIFSNFI